MDLWTVYTYRTGRSRKGAAPRATAAARYDFRVGRDGRAKARGGFWAAGYRLRHPYRRSVGLYALSLFNGPLAGGRQRIGLFGAAGPPLSPRRAHPRGPGGRPPRGAG